MADEAPVRFIERQDWLEPVETGVQKAVETAFHSTGETGQKVQDALHGKWLGHPLHPALTDIPTGAWTATLVLDLMEASGRTDLGPGADVALTVGLVGAASAALPGLTDWHVTEGSARRVGIVHGILNVVGTVLYTASLMERRKRNRSAGRALAFAGFAVVAMSAYLGGNLVFRQGAGTEGGAEANQSA